MNDIILMKLTKKLKQLPKAERKTVVCIAFDILQDMLPIFGNCPELIEITQSNDETYNYVTKEDRVRSYDKIANSVPFGSPLSTEQQETADYILDNNSRLIVSNYDTEALIQFIIDTLNDKDYQKYTDEVDEYINDVTLQNLHIFVPDLDEEACIATDIDSDDED